MQYRWLDTDQPVVSVGKRSVMHGRTGRIIALPRPRALGNVLVDFEGTLAIVPFGTLRQSQSFPRTEPRAQGNFLQENLNSAGGGTFHSGAAGARMTQFDYEGWWS